MCFFSDDEGHAPGLTIHDTRIFARGDGPRQWLAYSLYLETAGDVAMILPLPVPAGAPEDAAVFVDLSPYPTLFADLATCMAGGHPPEIARGERPPVHAGALPGMSGRPAARQAVKPPGRFETSVRPSR